MGRTISQATYERQERNRKNGRACGFNSSHRATINTTQTTWTYERNQGPSHELQMVYCRSCYAKYIQPHNGGRNFIVNSVEVY